MNVAAARKDATIAKLRQTGATLRAEQVALGYTRILAPMAGIVVSIEAQEGQTLNANYEAPEILRIADLAVMTVWTEVSEADVIRLSIGMPLSFTTFGHADRVWRATLREILPVPHRPSRRLAGDRPAAKGNVVSYTALFDVENGDSELRAEMTAQVSFIHARSQNAIAVPVAAFQMADNAEGATRPAGRQIEPGRAPISILDPDGKVSVRDVVTGVRGRRFIEAMSGVSVGERVIVGTVRRAVRSSFRVER
jgi:macrolide-specific efflux system membrane fusion protein